MGAVDVHRTAALGFEQAADVYERARPDYPPEAIAWLVDRLGLDPASSVVDVGAGTGKLTRLLLPTGAEIVAVEPVAAMRAELERACPGATVLEGTAEALPLGDEAADAIVCAQAFHWFDGKKALTEFHRVLRPGERLALLWNRRRLDQPLQQEITRVIEPHRSGTPTHTTGRWRQALEGTDLFAPDGEHHVPFDQVLDEEGLVERVASISFIATLGEGDRAGVLEEVRAVAATSGEPLRLGYETELFVYRRR
jgi:SAM-dependent methyltransferase